MYVLSRISIKHQSARHNKKLDTKKPNERNIHLAFVVL